MDASANAALSRPDDQHLTLTLPDGATREVPAGTLPREVVGGIGERLLRAAVAVEVEGEVQDLVTPLRRGGRFRVLTEKDPRALEVLRHSAAHVLATAVRARHRPRRLRRRARPPLAPRPPPRPPRPAARAGRPRPPRPSRPAPPLLPHPPPGGFSHHRLPLLTLPPRRSRRCHRFCFYL